MNSVVKRINALIRRRHRDAATIRRLKDASLRILALIATTPNAKRALTSAEELERLTSRWGTKIPALASNPMGRIYDYVYERNFGAANRLLNNLIVECKEAQKSYKNGTPGLVLERVIELSKKIKKYTEETYSL